ncbi:MAG: BamA/OMP85 family outer membrane protein [Ignavibacteriaceae bacterium]
MQKLNDSELNLANAIITPQINSYKINDFIHIRALILSGYQAALPEMNKIKIQIDSLFRKRFTINNYYLKKVMLTGNESELDRPYIQKYSMEDSVSSYDILDDLYSIYSTGYYKNLSAQVIQYSNYATVQFVGEKNPVIKKIDLNGISLISDSLAQDRLASLVGLPYSAKNVVSKLITLLNLYRNLGYSLADIKNINFDKETGILHIFVNEGKISAIEILGNKHTNRTIITREIPIKIGDYFNYNNINRGLTNLRSTNIFEDIYFSVKTANGRDVLVVNVHEKDSSLLRVGFLVDNENNAQLSLNLVDDNLFGSGTELGLLLLGSSRSRAFALEHKSNRIFNTYLTYKINAYYKFDDIYNYVEGPTNSTSTFHMLSNGAYRQIFYGGSVSVGTQVERFGNLIFEGKYQVDQVKNISSSPVNPLRTSIVSLKVSSTVDTQNKYPYPTSGIYFKGNYEAAQNALGGQVGFTNINFDYKNYFTLGNVNTISPRLMMGFADKTLPLSEEYSLGGQSSFFGMMDNEFRGRQIFLASLEYRYKLPFQIFFDTYIKCRYDLGSTWDEQEEIRFKDLRHGIGTTLSFDTPIGPADFSVGRSFLFVKNLPGNPLSWGDYYFYFSIGYYY